MSQIYGWNWSCMFNGVATRSNEHNKCCPRIAINQENSSWTLNYICSIGKEVVDRSLSNHMEQIQLYILAFVIKKVWWSHWTVPKNRSGENISWIFLSNNINCVWGACKETSIIATIATPKWQQKLHNILRERKTLAHQLYQCFIIYAAIKRKRKEQIMSAISKRSNNKIQFMKASDNFGADSKAKESLALMVTRNVH